MRPVLEKVKPEGWRTALWLPEVKGRREAGPQKGSRGHFGEVMRLFCVCIVVVVSRRCAFVKTHETRSPKRVNCISCTIKKKQ